MPITKANLRKRKTQAPAVVKVKKELRVKKEATLKEERNNNNETEVGDKHDGSNAGPNGAKPASCRRCNLVFASEEDRKAHRDAVHPRSLGLYCKICTQHLPNYKALHEHLKQHTGKKPYTCLQCSKSFVGLELFTAHVREHAGLLPYACKVCAEGFKFYSDYLRHKPVHVLRKSDVARPRRFDCDRCPMKFGKLCDLERHLRVHTGEKPFVCNVCNGRFQQAHNLTKHMNIHTMERKYACDVCGKEFVWADSHKRHMLTHTVNKPHKCLYCDKSFGRYQQLTRHVERRHSELVPTSKSRKFKA